MQTKNQLLTSEKDNFLIEIRSIKNDLKSYENTGKTLQQLHIKFNSSLKFQEDLLKFLKNEAPQKISTKIDQMIRTFQKNINSPYKGQNILKIEDLNQSKLSIKSNKSISNPKCRRSLSLSNKSQKSCEKNKKMRLNTSMLHLQKKNCSPIVKSKKTLSQTNSSSNKKIMSNKKNIVPSPFKTSPIKNVERKSSKNNQFQCLLPIWNNEKLNDIHNILNSTATEEQIDKNKENMTISCNTTKQKIKDDEMKKIEKSVFFYTFF